MSLSGTVAFTRLTMVLVGVMEPGQKLDAAAKLREFAEDEGNTAEGRYYLNMADTLEGKLPRFLTALDSGRGKGG